MPDLPIVDEPPSSGVYVDHDVVAVSPQEAVEGNAQGELIDVDDDTDNGLSE